MYNQSMGASKATVKHKWTFVPRFRSGTFGWRSDTPIKRIKEAVSEIKKVARKDAVLAGEGAVLFLEKVSPALMSVDSSSGAIGSTVNWAIEALAPIIATATAEDAVRDKWLDRLWEAVQEDQMPYIEYLPDFWGEMCVTAERASRWADDFIDTVRISWSPEHRGWFSGTYICLSCLFKAGRYAELLALIDEAPYKSWSDRQWGVQALLEMDKQAEALRYAEDSQGRNVNPVSISKACEEILLASGLADEAYSRYALTANERTTYLATFRAIAKKYPHKDPAGILDDLAAGTPGREGKWFAAAKSVGLFDKAIEFANISPCDPLTLIRAARDARDAEPRFAVEAGMAALKWLVAGYGYEITGMDVRAAYSYAMEAADNAGRGPDTFARIRAVVAGEPPGQKFVTKALARELGLN